jgi:hypothetical protein
MRRAVFAIVVLAQCTIAVGSEPLPVITDVEAQPLAAQAKRIAQALELVGAPLATDTQTALDRALAEDDAIKRVSAIQTVRTLEADGRVNDMAFDFTPEKSSWIAVRIPLCAHTNPVFVEVDGKPIRADKRSAQWCLDAVDVCWKSKVGKIRESERAAAATAYDAARQAYRRILAECEM